MNPSNIGFPCTLGDRITDSMTSVEGICSGFKVRSDGSKVVCIAWNAHGDPRYLWVSDTRVMAGRTPEQIAADVERAQAEARRAMNEAGIIDDAPAATPAAGAASAPAAEGARRRRRGTRADGGEHPARLEGSEE